MAQNSSSLVLFSRNIFSPESENFPRLECFPRIHDCSAHGPGRNYVHDAFHKLLVLYTCKSNRILTHLYFQNISVQIGSVIGRKYKSFQPRKKRKGSKSRRNKSKMGLATTITEHRAVPSVFTANWVRFVMSDFFDIFSNFFFQAHLFRGSAPGCLARP